MRIPFINEEQNSSKLAITDDATHLEKKDHSPVESFDIEVISADEYSIISGGPQISNSPPV